MKSNNLVVDLCHAKGLKKVGFPQDTFFYYSVLEDNKIFLNSQHAYECEVDKDFVGKLKEETYSAPTAEEIFQYLPNYISGHCGNLNGFPLGQLQVEILNDGEYEVSFELEHDPNFSNKSLSIALSEMYIYLKEVGLL